jgi:hypothetical protein
VKPAGTAGRHDRTGAGGQPPEVIGQRAVELHIEESKPLQDPHAHELAHLLQPVLAVLLQEIPGRAHEENAESADRHQSAKKEQDRHPAAHLGAERLCFDPHGPSLTLVGQKAGRSGLSSYPQLASAALIPGGGAAVTLLRSKTGAAFRP